MPTARELLEQADALMRRDRDALAAGERPRPASTPVTLAPRPLAGAAMSPRTIQREPIAPSVARTSLPIHPTDSPAFSAPEAPWFAPAATPASLAEAPAAAPIPVDEAAATTDADFPTLTDAVVEIIEPAGDAAAFADGIAGDVPILTDAVDAVAGAEVDDLARGEPSIWDAAARGDMSVLGQPPDSVVVVPPLERMPSAPLSGRDPLGLDQPAPGFVAPASVLAPAPAVSAPEAEPPHVVPTEAAQEAERATETPGEATPEPDRAAAPSAWTEARGEPERAFETSVSSDRAAEPEPGQGAGLQEPMAMPPLHGDAGAGAVAEHGVIEGFAPLRPQPGYEAPSTFGGREEGGPDESGAAPALDDARIAEAVDEIRMQVLQRIDIFTDTTLRAKLGEQLQPLVERASAELVAAINQHVGDLLRTYVAEALEQEIERWRDSQH